MLVSLVILRAALILYASLLLLISILPDCFQMMEAPIGSAAFNNEFGRPCLVGKCATLGLLLPEGNSTTML